MALKLGVGTARAASLGAGGAAGTPPGRVEVGGGGGGGGGPGIAPRPGAREVDAPGSGRA